MPKEQQRRIEIKKWNEEPKKKHEEKTADKVEDGKKGGQ